MKRFFLDTSALVKRYHRELGSDIVNKFFQTQQTDLVISRLGVAELTSVFAGRLASKEISDEAFKLLRRKFLGDIATKTIKVSAVGPVDFSRTEKLIMRHRLELRLRTLDAIQLSVALGLQEAGLVNTFVCCDKRLLTLAAKAGFEIINPEEESLSDPPH